MEKTRLTPTQVQQLLEHIHSLHIVSVPDQLALIDANHLIELGYLRPVWINNYTLTAAGQRARRNRS